MFPSKSVPKNFIKKRKEKKENMQNPNLLRSWLTCSDPHQHPAATTLPPPGSAGHQPAPVDYHSDRGIARIQSKGARRAVETDRQRANKR